MSKRFPLLSVVSAVAAVVGTGALLAGLSASAATGEGIDAQALLQKNCTSCHGSEVYTRPDRKIHSLSALQQQVEFCNTNLDTKMFPDEVNAVANLLNKEYYKFGK
jgi:cytochrome c553